MRCAMCNRKITDPDSIARGIGPECFKKMVDAGQKKKQLSFNFEDEDNEQRKKG